MADNLKTAITLRRGVVAWTTLRQKKNVIEVVEQRDAQLELPDTVTDPAAPEVAEQIKAKCGELRGDLCIAIPSEQVLMRVANLPSTDPAELRSMAELQVDKFSPFPTDNMAIAVEVLSQKDGASRALIAAVLREHVTKLGDLFKRAGLSPREADIEALGWWKLLQLQGEVPQEGRHVTLIVEEPGIELVVTENGVPVIFRSLGSHKNLTVEESVAEIVDEIQYTLTTIESEWGAKELGTLRVWHADEAPARFLDLLRQGCAFTVESRHLDALPPLSEGLARRSMERGAAMADLAPPDWRVSIEQTRIRRVLLKTVAVFFGIWLLGAGGFLIGYQLQNSRLARVKADLAKLEGPALEVRQLKQEILSLKRYADRRYSGLECLREVSALLPDGVEITSFAYKKYAQVNIRGEADSDDPVYEFFKQLEGSELFAEVKPEGVTTQMRQGRPRSQFRVTCVLPGEKS